MIEIRLQVSTAGKKIMRFTIVAASILLATAISTFAQGGTPPKPAIAAVRPVAREKFDPKRDPAPDLVRAIAEAGKSGKRVILDVGGEWCSWCVYMDKFFVDHADLLKLRDDNYVWVKVNVSEENENKAFLAPYPEAPGYPHLYVLGSDGKLVKSADTSELEEGEGYNLKKFTEFLKTWSPSAAASKPNN